MKIEDEDVSQLRLFSCIYTYIYLVYFRMFSLVSLMMLVYNYFSCNSTFFCNNVEKIAFSIPKFGSELGSGAGKGGGGGGSVREAGGAFGKREAAAEEQYFRKLVRSLFFIL